jgi:hypothetical protein
MSSFLCFCSFYLFRPIFVTTRARICRRLWTLRHRFQESISFEKLIFTWTWDMGTSISYLFPNRFQESIFHPLTRLQIPALESGVAPCPWYVVFVLLSTFLFFALSFSTTFGKDLYDNLVALGLRVFLMGMSSFLCF